MAAACRLHVHQFSFQTLAHLVHRKNNVAGSSADLVWISLKYACLLPHDSQTVEVFCTFFQASSPPRTSSILFCCRKACLVMEVVISNTYGQHEHLWQFTPLILTICNKFAHVGQNEADMNDKTTVHSVQVPPRPVFVFFLEGLTRVK